MNEGTNEWRFPWLVPNSLSSSPHLPQAVQNTWQSSNIRCKTHLPPTHTYTQTHTNSLVSQSDCFEIPKTCRIKPGCQKTSISVGFFRVSPCLERRRGFLICDVALNWVALFDIFPTLKDAAERNAVKRGQTAAGRGCWASSDAACESVTAEVCVWAASHTSTPTTSRFTRTMRGLLRRDEMSWCCCCCHCWRSRQSTRSHIKAAPLRRCATRPCVVQGDSNIIEPVGYDNTPPLHTHRAAERKLSVPTVGNAAESSDTQRSPDKWENRCSF